MGNGLQVTRSGWQKFRWSAGWKRGVGKAVLHLPGKYLVTKPEPCA